MKVRYLLWVIVIIAITLLVDWDDEKDALSDLTRIDVKFKSNKSETEKIITDSYVLDEVRGNYNNIRWEENVKPSMDREPDVKATFFYQYDKNQPEYLVEYFIWFDESVDATIIDPQKHRYGRLDSENGKKLRELFMN